jgi:RNase P/RNase MRP subunit p29
MRIAKQLIVMLLLILPGLALGELTASGLPATSTWYFHADFDEMRGSEAGRPLYAWLQREVFADVRDDAGIDLDKEADRITAFSAAESGAVVSIEGNISQETRDKLLAIAAGADEFDTLKHRGSTFYFAKGDNHDGNNKIEVDSFENGVYFTFDLDDRILATSSREQMQFMLDNEGRLPDRKTERGTLIVLSAEKSLIQAGIQADQVQDDGDGGWRSNILRNTEQLAVMVADAAGKIAVETRLIATQPEMAESLASIVRGLISLAMFSEDMDPEVAEFLMGTTVDVDGSMLNIRLALDPESVVVALDD